MRGILFSASILAVSLALAGRFGTPSAGEIKDAGFESIFDGRTLTGWHASAQTGHSCASGNKSGGRWVGEIGALVGSQDIPGNGGIGLQVHGGGDFTKQYVRYRNLRVKRLDASK